MDSATFESLMEKLNSATWTLRNATSNTQFLVTSLGGHVVEIYNTPTAPGLYINNYPPDLTGDQKNLVIALTEELLAGFQTDIQQALQGQQQDMDSAVQDIINE